MEAAGTGVVVRVLTRYTELVEAMIEVAVEAHEYLVVTGSRSREKSYLAAIENAVAQQPDLVHYRVLYGPPRHAELADHLVRLWELRDPGERRNGVRTLRIGVVHQREVLDVGSAAPSPTRPPTSGASGSWGCRPRRSCSSTTGPRMSGPRRN